VPTSELTNQSHHFDKCAIEWYTDYYDHYDALIEILTNQFHQLNQCAINHEKYF